jgi:hypothetical protein
MAGAGRAGLAPKSRGREHEGRPGCERGEARPPSQEFPRAGGGGRKSGEQELTDGAGRGLLPTTTNGGLQGGAMCRPLTG